MNNSDSDDYLEFQFLRMSEADVNECLRTGSRRGVMFIVKREGFSPTNDQYEILKQRVREDGDIFAELGHKLLHHSFAESVENQHQNTRCAL